MEKRRSTDAEDTATSAPSVAMMMMMMMNIPVERTEPGIAIYRTEKKHKHAQTFNSFDDFLDEDDDDGDLITIYSTS